MNTKRYEIQFKVGLGWSILAETSSLLYARDIVAARRAKWDMYRITEITEVRKEVPLTNE
jgi:hypothetical protein